MKIKISGIPSAEKGDTKILLAEKNSDWKDLGFSKEEQSLLIDHVKSDIRQIHLHDSDVAEFIVILENKELPSKRHEAVRKAGASLCNLLNKHKISSVCIENKSGLEHASLLIAEGMALMNYQFIKYKKEAKKEAHSISAIHLLNKEVSADKILELQSIAEAVYLVRDLVNEPVNKLNAVDLSKAIVKAGKDAGFKTQVFNKAKIKALKMGGLLSVNQGSIDPPTFSIMEWKPKNAVNKNPVVLVGKGVVYDTGGLSLKPTGNSMDYMKSDMAGAATMTGIMYVIGKTKLPLHVVGLVPSTDNRLGGNAFAPGDIITMYDGTTVEMLNSDAEGRMILADALSYAKKYKPELVIDMATLTGAAERALGELAAAYMSTTDDATNKLIEEAGFDVNERLVKFPLWDEYGDWLKSDIADMKNVAGPNAGMITAGKFLEHFTDYPWIHLDIAGKAFLHAEKSYFGKNATAFGLRLVYHFLKNRMQAK